MMNIDHFTKLRNEALGCRWFNTRWDINLDTIDITREKYELVNELAVLKLKRKTRNEADSQTFFTAENIRLFFCCIIFNQ